MEKLNLLTQKVHEWVAGGSTCEEPRPDFISSAADNDPGADDTLIRNELAHIRDQRIKAANPNYAHQHIGAIHDHFVADMEAKQHAPQDPEADASQSEDDGEKPYLFGLALSGGGIRSAVFSLGVMQKLSQAGILRHVDYLSTVSGGGYIGAALSWWLSGRCKCDKPYGLDPTDFPYGTKDPTNPANTTEVLNYLRQNGNYLIPGAGITLFSGIAIVLRAMLLNLLVWIPILAFVFLLVRKLDRVLDSTIGLGPLDKLLAAIAEPLFAEPTTITSTIPGLFAIAILLALFGASVFFVSSIAFSLNSWTSRDQPGSAESRPPATEPTDQRPKFSSIRRERRFLVVTALFVSIAALIYAAATQISAVAYAPPEQIAGNLIENTLLLVVFLITILLLQAYVEGLSSLQPRTSWRYFLVLGGFVVLWVLNGVFSLAAEWVRDGALAEGFAVASFGCEIIVLVGGATLIFYWLALAIEHTWRDDSISLSYSSRRRFERLYGIWFPVLIALLVLASIPFVATLIGDTLREGAGAISVLGGAATALWGHFQSQGKSAPGNRTKLVLVIGSILLLYGVLLLSYQLATRFDKPGDTVILAAFAAFSAIVGWFVNINYISIHRYYRDRLMEAFMPDYLTAKDNLRMPAGLADDFHISELGKSACPGPFHLVNTNAVLVNSSNRKFALRGGDNFILSPLYCGSSATGWQATCDFIQGGMTLATAMAISGAAANPRAGVGGQGVTRNKFVSLAMTFLNLRLGYYVRRPGKERPARVRPNHFSPGGTYVLPTIGYTEDSSFQELSDGGHFENLALYELVRRRCGLIVICDGGQDTQASYSDFVTALQLIGQDFGATVSFDLKINDVISDPKHLIPRATEDFYPKGAEYSKKGYFIARMNYNGRGGGAWPNNGLVIYMKTAMIDGLDMKAKGYKGANPDFPDETTADQFFSEPQFEAYRCVGYKIAEQMIKDLELEAKFSNDKRPSLTELRALPQKQQADDESGVCVCCCHGKG